MSIKGKIKRIITSVDKKNRTSFFYSFIMTTKEKKLFDKRIKSSKVYLEFGMGGSTFRALQKSNAKVYSLDSSTVWISQMREYLQIRRFESEKRLFLFHVDIGPTRDWGRPVNVEMNEKFPNYSSEIFTLIDKSEVDTVLIDGRFRVACGLKTILELHKNKELQIIIHDFWNREIYHVLLKYLDSIEKVESLGVFKLKDRIDMEAVKEDYEFFKLDVE